MDKFFDTILLVYAGLFPIVNPIGGAPVFLGLTACCTVAERNSLARRVAVNSVLLLAGSLFIGSHVLVFFGITLPVVRIAGGLVLIAFGWKLLQTGTDVETERSGNTDSPSSTMDSFYPLTMPLTVGPGSMSVAIALGSQRPSDPLGLYQLALLASPGVDVEDRREQHHAINWHVMVGKIAGQPRRARGAITLAADKEG